MLLMLATAIKLVFFLHQSWSSEEMKTKGVLQTVRALAIVRLLAVNLPPSPVQRWKIHACMHACEECRFQASSGRLAVCLSILLSCCGCRRILPGLSWARPVTCGLLVFQHFLNCFFFSFLQTEEEYILIFLLENKRREERRWMKPPIQGLWRGAIRIRWVQIWRVVYLPDQIHGTRRGIIPVTSKKSSLSAEGKRLAALVGASFWEGKTRGSTKAQAEQRGFFLKKKSPGSPSPLSPLLRPTPSILLGLLYASMPRRLKHS